MDNLPDWLIEYAYKICEYMDRNHPGHWELGGLMKREDSHNDYKATMKDKPFDVVSIGDSVVVDYITEEGVATSIYVIVTSKEFKGGYENYYGTSPELGFRVEFWQVSPGAFLGKRA